MCILGGLRLQTPQTQRECPRKGFLNQRGFKKDKINLAEEEKSTLAMLGGLAKVGPGVGGPGGAGEGGPRENG